MITKTIEIEPGKIVIYVKVRPDNTHRNMWWWRFVGGDESLDGVSTVLNKCFIHDYVTRIKELRDVWCQHE